MKEAAHMHIFSMTCKVDSVLDLFSAVEGRRTAVKWFKEHHISKVYLETYRHKRYAGAELLRIVKDDFTAAGLEVAACITTTQMSKRVATWGITTCFTDPAAHDFLQEVVKRTASVFDLIILDDFFFSSCICSFCEKDRNGRTWGDFRTDLLLNIARERVLLPARAVNKDVKLIIKYPLWYEGYYRVGYDVLRETELFDYTWVGTETREPDSGAAGRRPQTSASWIQAWMNDVSKGKCGGAWYDPIDTKPETFLEQARQSIIGGARESLLHCYDYLATRTPGLAIHGKDLEIKNGLADAEVFRNEANSLQVLAETLSEMQPYGILLPKKANDDSEKEAYLPSFAGMLGIPVVASASLKNSDAVFLGAQAGNFNGIDSYIENALRENKSLVVTSNFLNMIKADLCKKLLSSCKVVQDDGEKVCVNDINESLTVLHCPSDLWDLMSLQQDELDRMRNKLLKPFRIEFFAPSRVSLHLFKSENSLCEIIENFNDFPVSVCLKFNGKTKLVRSLKLVLPKKQSATLAETDASYSVKLKPRSMALLSAIV